MSYLLLCALGQDFWDIRYKDTTGPNRQYFQFSGSTLGSGVLACLVSDSRDTNIRFALFANSRQTAEPISSESDMHSFKVWQNIYLHFIFYFKLSFTVDKKCHENCMTRKSCQMFIVYSLYKNIQDFWDIQCELSRAMLKLSKILHVQEVFFNIHSVR